MFVGAGFGFRATVVIPAAVVTSLLYFTYRLITHRRFYRDLPKPPHSLFWGHLKLVGLTQAKFPKSTFFAPILAQIKREHDLGDIFYLDLWPLGPCFMVLTAPDAVAIPSTVHALPQSYIVINFNSWSIGTGFIETANGALWKHLYRLIAPALTPASTRAYLPWVVRESVALHDRLSAVADSGESLPDFGYEVGQVSFGILPQLLFGEEVDAETKARLYDDAKALVENIGDATTRAPTPLHGWWLRKTRGRTLRRRVEAVLGELIDRKYADMVKKKDVGLLGEATSLPIVDRMLLDTVLNGEPLDAPLKRIVIENGTGIFVAGYGTTTDASCYIAILLSTHPEALRKVREEHDEVFGPTYDGTLASLQDDPGKLKKLEYTKAVIQETLRLFSLGYVVRDPLPDMAEIQYKGVTYPVNNHTFGLCMYALHHDEEIFPDPNKFKPERFLGRDPSDDALRNAYRPFERGLRACPGQPLAMEEMRIALLMTARWFDFELMDHEPSKEPRFSHTDMDTIIGKHAFQHVNVAPCPVGKVRFKVSKARPESN